MISPPREIESPARAISSNSDSAASNFRFVKEFPDAANFVMDCNHWHDPRKPKAQELRKEVEKAGGFFTYNIPMNYSSVMLLADAIEPHLERRGIDVHAL